MMDSKRQEFHATNGLRISSLVKKFTGCYASVSSRRIKDFLNQFSPEHMDLGLKVLEQVCYFTPEAITNQVRLLVSLLCQEIDLQKSNVYFCTMSMSPGQSADTVMGIVRRVANMSSSTYNDKFVYLKDLESWQSNENKRIIIFIDDFIGSGQTVSGVWTALQNWYNEEHQYYVGVIIGYERIMKQIEDETPFKVIHAIKLAENTRVFHNYNSVFSKSEKAILKKYCKIADKRPEFRYGYKNSQSLIAFYDNTPNNTIPILHHRSANWRFPPLPRLE